LTQIATATPLSKPEVIKLIRKNVQERRLLAVVRELGIDFKLTAEAVDELRAAGASPTLLQGLQGLVVPEESPPRTLPPSPAPAPGAPPIPDRPPARDLGAPEPAPAPPPTADLPGKWEAVKPLLEEAKARVVDGDIRGAQTLLARAIEIDPGEPQVWKAFKEIEQDLLARAETYLADGQVARALREFQVVITTNPESALGHNGVGSALLQLKNYDEAVAAFERALALEPGNVRYRQALTRARSLQRASKALERQGQENLKEMIGDQPGRKKGP
jgi:tetratricopeptide (TPR) repeat protein